MTTKRIPGPLDDVLVVDFSRVVAGPTCGRSPSTWPRRPISGTVAREHNRPVANEIIVWGDVLAGLHAANAVVGALRHRDRTGPGTHLDIAMAEAVLASMGRDDLLADDPVPIPRGAIRSGAFHAGARDVLGWQGQHNRSVLSDLLGVGDEEVDRLVAHGVLIERRPGGA